MVNQPVRVVQPRRGGGGERLQAICPQARTDAFDPQSFTVTPTWKPRPGSGAMYFSGELCGRAS